MERVVGSEAFTELMRPQKLSDFVGNQHIFDESTGILINLIRSANPDCPPSILVTGPSGSGKTSLSRIYHQIFVQFHKKPQAHFVFREISSNEYKKEAFDEFILTCESLRKHPIFFIDEIHCLTSTEQAIFLSNIEENKLTLVGATTEAAEQRIIEGLRSRLVMLNLRPPETKEVLQMLVKTLNTLKPLDLTLPLDQQVDAKALCIIAKRSGEDFRKALEMLQASILNGRITMEQTEMVVSTAFTGGDTTDMYYDSLSGLQKSIRASDPQGAIFFLAVLLRIKADELAVCRRLIAIASEDVGLADPIALQVAVNCFEAVQAVGEAEGRLPMAECTLYLAKANKSNSAYMALENVNKWLDENEDRRDLWRPRPSYRRGSAGDDYKYPHDLGGQILDSALEEELQEVVFYRDREW